MDFIKFIVFLLTVELLNLTNKASENDDHSFQTWFVQITSNSYVQLARHAERRVQTHCISTCFASTRSTRQALTSSLLLCSNGFHPRHPLQISWSWTWSIKACWVDDAWKHLLHQWKLALCVSESTSTVHQLTCTLKWPALFTHNHCLLILGIFWNHFSQSTTALVCSCYVYMRPSKRQKSSSNGDITSVSPGWKAAGLPARLPPGEDLNGWPTSGRFWKKLRLHNNPNSNIRIFRLANTKDDDSSRSLLPVCFKQISLDRWTRAPFFEYQPFSSVPPIWRAASLFGSQQDAWSSNQVVVPRWKPRHCTATTHALIQESPQELSLCSLSPLLEFGLTILKQRSLPLSLNHQKHPKRACCHSPGPDRRAANTITTSQPSHNESLASPSPFHPMLKCSRKAVRSASASYVAKCAVRVVPIDATGKYHYDDMSKMI